MATVMLDDLLADRQPQAGALRLAGVRVVHLVKFLENQLVLVARDARTVIDHFDAPAVRHRP